MFCTGSQPATLLLTLFDEVLGDRLHPLPGGMHEGGHPVRVFYLNAHPFHLMKTALAIYVYRLLLVKFILLFISTCSHDILLLVNKYSSNSIELVKFFHHQKKKKKIISMQYLNINY